MHLLNKDKLCKNVSISDIFVQPLMKFSEVIKNISESLLISLMIQMLPIPSCITHCIGYTTGSLAEEHVNLAKTVCGIVSL